MSPDDDPLLRALESLPPIAADAAWESRVRVRCHSALSRRHTLRRWAGRNLSRGILAVPGVVGLALYLVMVLAEAVRLAKHF